MSNELTVTVSPGSRDDLARVLRREAASTRNLEHVHPQDRADADANADAYDAVAASVDADRAFVVPPDVGFRAMLEDAATAALYAREYGEARALACTLARLPVDAPLPAARFSLKALAAFDQVALRILQRRHPTFSWRLDA